MLEQRANVPKMVILSNPPQLPLLSNDNYTRYVLYFFILQLASIYLFILSVEETVKFVAT